jgi:hypothetical protein
MWRIWAHGLVFTRFQDPQGECWVEILRAADGSLVGYERIVDPHDDLDEVVERWIREQLGAEPPAPMSCARCGYTVWTDDIGPHCRPGDQAVEIDATIEIGGVIRFLRRILCRDCAEGAFHEHSWLPSLSDGEL